jgi:lipoprotein NlpI
MKRYLFLLAAATLLAQDNPETLFETAVADFHAGRIAESVARFDKLAKLVPGRAPQLWQRGIALYYAGRFNECRQQFESHRTVNPDDVENAAWHYLCVARAESPAKARAALLPVGPDERSPMSEIYRMFEGKTSPKQVLDAAGTDLQSHFYAHLYIGLYYEAQGDKARAKEHIRTASNDRYRVGGYMHSVAQIHARRME